MENKPGRWLSVRTAAAYLDLRPGTVRTWIREGLLPAVRIMRRHSKGRGRHICTLRIDRLRLDRWLESRAR